MSIARTAVRLRTGVPWAVGGYLATLGIGALTGAPLSGTWWFVLIAVPAAVYRCGGVDVKEYDKETDEWPE